MLVYKHVSLSRSVPYGSGGVRLGGSPGMAEDQVVRLMKFRQDHPDIDIRKPNYASGARLWSAHRDGLCLCCSSELRDFLDHLDWLLAQPCGAAS